MKAKIDKKLCKFCEFADKGNANICLPKIMGNGCKFDK